MPELSRFFGIVIRTVVDHLIHRVRRFEVVGSYVRCAPNRRHPGPPSSQPLGPRRGAPR